jgi:SET domain-containing protein
MSKSKSSITSLLKSFPVPSYVELRLSTIPEAGHGIFAKEIIKKGKRLGEYKGEFITIEKYDKLKNTTYIWELTDDKGDTAGYINGRSKKNGNWLRFVNCPRNQKELNVEAVQEPSKTSPFKSTIVYYALRDIKPKEELFVFYGPDYCEELMGYGELPLE